LKVWNLWHAQYWLAGIAKAITAAASISTAILLTRLVPQALDLASGDQWSETNQSLQKELQRSQALEFQLRLKEPIVKPLRSWT
jgi:hypothetical protein